MKLNEIKDSDRLAVQADLDKFRDQMKTAWWFDKNTVAARSRRSVCQYIMSGMQDMLDRGKLTVGAIARLRKSCMDEKERRLIGYSILYKKRTSGRLRSLDIRGAKTPDEAFEKAKKRAATDMAPEGYREYGFVPLFEYE